MNRRITAMVAMATALLGLGWSGPAAAEPPWPSGASSAVVGTNAALYVRSAGQTTWTNLGGVLISAPAVAVVGEGPEQVTHYVGIGGNGMLYQRTATTGWRRLTTLEYRCTQVSLTSTGTTWDTTVYGACTAANNAGYAFSFDGSLTRPTVGLLTKISDNGQVFGQMSAQFWQRKPVFTAVGPSYVSDAGEPGNVWAYLDGEWTQSELFSVNPPGADSTGTYEAYQQPDGTIQIWCTEPAFVSYLIPGRGIGAPALTLNDDGSAQIIVTGTNRAIYSQRITCDGTGLSGWTVLSGLTPFGPASAAPL